MSAVSCKDLGGDCSYKAEGDSLQEVKEKLFTHTRTNHPEKLTKMSPDDVNTLNKKIEDLYNS